jgi:hypothetical protein
MKMYPKGRILCANINDINDEAIAAAEFWPVARTGKRTKRILAKFATQAEAEERARKYKGKCQYVYICGLEVNNHNEIPKISKET